MEVQGRRCASAHLLDREYLIVLSLHICCTRDFDYGRVLIPSESSLELLNVELNRREQRAHPIPHDLYADAQ